MLTLPYVTTAAFKAHPTFLDIMNLRPGDVSASDQDAELQNILLLASAMADSYVELGTSSGASASGTLAAHSRTENARIRTKRDGRISYHPQHIPVIQPTALSLGTVPSNLTPVSDLTNFWVENDGRQIVGYTGGTMSPGFNALQFGSIASSLELFAQWTLLVGYPNMLLASAVSAGAMTLPVQDATGVVAGSVLRIWDPGVEEAVTVASTYTGGTNLPLTTGLRNAHGNAAATGVSGLPADAHLAVILYGAALLQRPDSEKEDTYPSASVHPNSRVGSNVDGSGFVNEAENLLEPFRRVR